jgi:invasion protein IalB
MLPDDGRRRKQYLLHPPASIIGNSLEQPQDIEDVMQFFSGISRLSLSAAAGILLLQAGAAAQEQQQATQPEPAPWAVRCVSESRGGPVDCMLEQRVVVSGTNQLLVGASVYLRANASLPQLVLQTPLGLHLPAGVKVAVDDRELQTLPLRTCDAGGCYAELTLEAQAVVLLKQGNNMTVTFKDLSEREIPVPVSLKGFTAAFDKSQ